MQGLRTALIVRVPEAEHAVGQLRARLDPVAALGVPAHISVLFPFVPAAELDAVLLARIEALFRSAAPFTYRLDHIDWFGDDVLWLGPDAEAEFRSLTHRVWTEFPDWPPYEGRFADVVPHLTVADRGPVDEMRTAGQALETSLPIEAAAREVTLMVEQPSGRWIEGARFALAGQR